MNQLHIGRRQYDIARGHYRANDNDMVVDMVVGRLPAQTAGHHTTELGRDHAAWAGQIP